MRIVGNNPQLSRQTQATASGAITGGKPVIVNTDGTVSVPLPDLTQTLGSAVVFNSGTTNYTCTTFDSNSNRLVTIYKDESNSNKGTVIVGTVSSTSVSYGSESLFNDGTTTYMDMDFDSNSNRVVIAYTGVPANEYGTAIVGSVDPSDNSISFGTPVVYYSGGSAWNTCTFDSTNNRIVITYRTYSGGSSTGVAIVGSVDNSDNSISFGTPVVFNNYESAEMFGIFDSSNGKVVISFQDGQNVSGVGRGNAIVGNVDPSDNSISFGSKVDFSGAINTNSGTPLAFDSNSNKIVALYSKSTDSGKGYAKVGTVSGTSISFGSETAFESSAAVRDKEMAFDSNVNKVLIAYDLNETDLKYVVGTVSGTSISFGTAAVFSTSNGLGDESIDVTFDSSNNKVVISFRDQSNSNYGTSHVFQNASTSTLPLTSENFIGFAEDTVADGQPVTINTKGAIDENQSSLTPAQQYFVQTDGTLGTSADDPSVVAGTAVTATKLIVKG